METGVYGIIGYPLGHTLSPVLHNWGFDLLNIDAKYEAWPLHPEELFTFMSGYRSRPVDGCSVTIPHKQAIREYLDDQTYRAESVGAVNTLFWDKGKLTGDNTDVLGVVGPLKAIGRRFDSALVLGAGGAARAAVAGLIELGVKDIVVANRTSSKAVIIAHDFGIRAARWEERQHTHCELLVNTTPLGMAGEFEQYSPWPLAVFDKDTVVFDLVYNPLKTRLIEDAENSGCKTVSGLEMFLHQGLAQFKIWTGKELNPDKARVQLLSILANK